MSEDYTPSIGYLADCYWAFKMRDYDEHLTGKPYEVARLEYHTEFNRAIAAHDTELREKTAREILDERLAAEPHLRKKWAEEIREGVNPPDTGKAHEWRRGFITGVLRAARFLEGAGE